MENQTLVIPEDLALIAGSVSVEKRNEVQSVLNHVFDGVSKMRGQLDAVVVSDENDKAGMKLANTIRLEVKRIRLEAEKEFDKKRAEVQQQMLSFKTEDSLWLKAKQTMQLLTKEIEENAKWKEETRERFEKEQKELKIQQRILKVSKVAPAMPRSEFENMSDDSFEIFMSGIEKAYNERIEAEKKAEEERIAKEKADNEERERIRLENERLKAEAKEKELQFQKEREEAAAKAAAEKAKAEAEKRAIEEAARKAKNAPDKTKLSELASRIENFDFPEVNGDEAKKILNNVKTLLAKVTVFIREKSTNI